MDNQIRQIFAKTFNLNISDINNSEGIIRCIGKGQKERLIPINSSALFSIDKYIARERTKLGRKNKSQALFLNIRGQRITRQSVWLTVKKLFKMYVVRVYWVQLFYKVKKYF